MKNRNAKRYLCWWILALCLLIPTSRQIVLAQQDQSKQAQDCDTESGATEPPHQRIVDPKKFPARSPLLARPLLAPFRWLAPRANRGLTTFEQSNVPERLRIILRNP